ncbi:glycine cleavage system protein H [Polluticoccus soli]|uniref:glycine cleavage system protein H n=1 Tax=Polluticoccus soli TaxID=3034150 RepID=UPI0023E0C49A|nr:hypothetical protein [Flavipsychrobacter sp. JY13-12]
MLLDEAQLTTCYFTKDYEWIRFDDSTAYVGVCDFKLIGITDIQKIELVIPARDGKQGDLVANIISEDYSIPVHMPVGGRFIESNQALISSPNTLLQSAQTSGWIIKIQPLLPYAAAELLDESEYSKKQTRMKTSI